MTDFVYNIRDIKDIRDIVESCNDLFAERTAFIFREGENVREITFAEVFDDVRAFTAYLNSKGLEGKKVAVMGKNSYHWALTYLTVCAGVGIVVPLDKDLSKDDIGFLINDSETAAVVYSPEQADKVPEKEGLLKLSKEYFEDYLAEGRALREAGDRSYEAHKVDPFALGMLIYTSGTTGVAKGVMLSQYNVCSNILHVMRRTLVEPKDRVLSVLPLHHTYECMAGFLSIFYSGASIAYNESLRTLQADFALFKPTIFIAVPILLEKLYRMIEKKYFKLKGGRAVLALQKSFSSMTSSYEARRKLFGAISTTLGGKLNRILCGAASLTPEVFDGYEKFGYKVYIGYGLTETAPVCIMHNDLYRSPDDIGFPLVGVLAKISEPNAEGIGELAVKGPNVMLGYYNNQKETDKVLRDGWFYTGDLAMQTKIGSYKIVGRLKSMIVAPNGKKIFPEEIEYYLELSKLVSESMVFDSTDDGSQIIVASVYPDGDEVKAELAKRGLEENDENVRAILWELVQSVNARFPQYKSVRKLIVRKDEFIKTTTHKIKRLEEENQRDCKEEEV